MLNRQENEVMKAVYSMCDGKGSCLVSPMEIMSILPEKKKYSPDRVEKILHSLELDDYFDPAPERGSVCARAVADAPQRRVQDRTFRRGCGRNVCRRADFEKYFFLKCNATLHFIFAPSLSLTTRPICVIIQ